MTAALTDGERALWAAAQSDYTHALAIAKQAWGQNAPPETIQAATATLLIHITKLRSEERIHVRVPPNTAVPGFGRGERAVASKAAAEKAAAGSVAVPPCPQCGGEMWDNRGKKKNPKSADFTCKQKSGECVNEKGFKTGVWLKDLNKDGANMKQRPTEGWDQMPAAIAQGDADESDLPF